MSEIRFTFRCICCNWRCRWIAAEQKYAMDSHFHFGRSSSLTLARPLSCACVQPQIQFVGWTHTLSDLKPAEQLNKISKAKFTSPTSTFPPPAWRVHNYMYTRKAIWCACVRYSQLRANLISRNLQFSQLRCVRMLVAAKCTIFHDGTVFGRVSVLNAWFAWIEKPGLQSFLFSV